MPPTIPRRKSNYDGKLEAKEEIIEIDFKMLSMKSAKAKRVKALYINERFMQTAFMKPTPKELTKMFNDIRQQMSENMESINVQLEETIINGRHLASAITPAIGGLSVSNGLELLSQADRQALGQKLYEHENLAEIRLNNIVIKEESGRFVWFKDEPGPPLDIMVPAFTSIVFLNILELSSTRESVEEIERPLLSRLGVQELCKSLTLHRLNLSQLGLTDDHFAVIVEQLSENTSSNLKELILNENKNTGSGIDMLSSLFFKSHCKLEVLECYQSDALIEDRTIDLLLQALETNMKLTTLRVHLWGDDADREPKGKEARLRFLMRLNKAGRRILFSKSSTNEQWLDVLTKAKDEPDLSFYFLRNSSFWWTLRSIESNVKPESVGKNPESDGKQEKTPGDLESTNSSDVEIASDSSGSKAKQVEDRKKKKLKSRVARSVSGSDSNLSIETKDIKEELAEKELPELLDLSNHSSDSDISGISLGAETYIQDLMHQKDKIESNIEEEVLEEAMDTLEYAMRNDKILPGMTENDFFIRVHTRLKKDRANEKPRRERKIAGLLEKELLKEMIWQESVKNGKTRQGDDEEPEKFDREEIVKLLNVRTRKAPGRSKSQGKNGKPLSRPRERMAPGRSRSQGKPLTRPKRPSIGRNSKVPSSSGERTSPRSPPRSPVRSVGSAPSADGRSPNRRSPNGRAPPGRTRSKGRPGGMPMRPEDRVARGIGRTASGKARNGLGRPGDGPQSTSPMNGLRKNVGPPPVHSQSRRPNPPPTTRGPVPTKSTKPVRKREDTV